MFVGEATGGSLALFSETAQTHCAHLRCQPLPQIWKPSGFVLCIERRRLLKSGGWGCQDPWNLNLSGLQVQHFGLLSLKLFPG